MSAASSMKKAPVRTGAFYLRWCAYCFGWQEPPQHFFFGASDFWSFAGGAAGVCGASLALSKAWQHLPFSQHLGLLMINLLERVTEGVDVSYARYRGMTIG